MTSKSMTDKAMTSKSMTNKAMTSKSMTDNSRSMSNRACCVNKRGSMDKGSSTDKRGLWVGCLTVISNFSDVSIVVIGVVVDMLDPSIRKSNRVATLTHTSSIIRLCSLEVGVGVVISHSIVVCVGRHLISIYLRSSMGH